jgi:farnesyl-diphosphate farnesyltransferase
MADHANMAGRITRYPREKMNAELTSLLRDTSRSFYLTLRVLPGAMRSQIGLAYLLARATDTISDTEILPVDQRLAALGKLRERIIGQGSAPLNFGEFTRHQGSPAEQMLLDKIETALALLPKLLPEDLKLVREVLTIITSGQELDLRRFGKAASENIVALQTAAELDDYTYRVAGCVGEFWTKMCRTHLFPKTLLDEKQLIADGIRFGKGLQLVNILRDLPTDLKNGRCYLPAQRLDEARLLPAVLLSPVNAPKFLPVYHEYLEKAESHLTAGWNYTNRLPFSQFRVRLACAWPILIGGLTIAKLRTMNVMELKQHVKISRAEVRGILFRSLAACPFPPAWRKLYSPAGKAVASRPDLA